MAFRNLLSRLPSTLQVASIYKINSFNLQPLGESLCLLLSVLSEGSFLLALNYALAVGHGLGTDRLRKTNDDADRAAYCRTSDTSIHSL